ncbi:hypothetical protein SDC9_144963 [bioreactor metagenome]|uniref:Uncharacterized protein n=1 Tax=bioreactor metagenome TaxID=1076179 RepID=A0A645E854_9ZZZZ
MFALAHFDNVVAPVVQCDVQVFHSDHAHAQGLVTLCRDFQLKGAVYAGIRSCFGARYKDCHPGQRLVVAVVNHPCNPDGAALPWFLLGNHYLVAADFVGQGCVYKYSAQYVGEALLTYVDGYGGGVLYM